VGGRPVAERCTDSVRRIPEHVALQHPTRPAAGQPARPARRRPRIKGAGGNFRPLKNRLNAPCRNSPVGDSDVGYPGIKDARLEGTAAGQTSGPPVPPVPLPWGISYGIMA